MQLEWLKGEDEFVRVQNLGVLGVTELQNHT